MLWNVINNQGILGLGKQTPFKNIYKYSNQPSCGLFSDISGVCIHKANREGFILGTGQLPHYLLLLFYLCDQLASM